jgi:hypothetical protein
VLVAQQHLEVALGGNARHTEYWNPARTLIAREPGQGASSLVAQLNTGCTDGSGIGLKDSSSVRRATLHSASEKICTSLTVNAPVKRRLMRTLATSVGIPPKWNVWYGVMRPCFSTAWTTFPARSYSSRPMGSVKSHAPTSRCLL